MWYKNVDRSFFPFVTMHAFDRRTDGFLVTRPTCIQCSAVKSGHDPYNHCDEDQYVVDQNSQFWYYVHLINIGPTKKFSVSGQQPLHILYMSVLPLAQCALWDHQLQIV